ncbi:MAG: SDR family NAD(P)-dependent oxidoreductase [Bacteroidota bacterium]
MQYALVTGAAKGIGKAIAEELAKRNYDLLLVDFDEKNLTKTENEFNTRFQRNVHTLHLDLTQPDAIDILWFWTQPFHKGLNVIVNNAGYGLNGAFENISIDEHINLIDLNIKAQLKIVHSFIPVLKQFPKSYLLNLGSTTSYQSVPYLSVYAASKAFVLSFTRSLRRELRHSTISVSCLSPAVQIRIL